MTVRKISSTITPRLISKTNQLQQQQPQKENEYQQSIIQTPQQQQQQLTTAVTPVSIRTIRTATVNEPWNDKTLSMAERLKLWREHQSKTNPPTKPVVLNKQTQPQTPAATTTTTKQQPKQQQQSFDRKKFEEQMSKIWSAETYEESTEMFDAMFSEIQWNGVDKFAEYWVVRALFEEQHGHYEEVVRLFEEAVQQHAEPIDQVFLGLNGFLLRRRENLLAQEIEEDQVRMSLMGTPMKAFNTISRTPLKRTTPRTQQTKQQTESPTQQQTETHMPTTPTLRNTTPKKNQPQSQPQQPQQTTPIQSNNDEEKTPETNKKVGSMIVLTPVSVSRFQHQLTQSPTILSPVRRSHRLSLHTSSESISLPLQNVSAENSMKQQQQQEEEKNGNEEMEKQQPELKNGGGLMDLLKQAGYTEMKPTILFSSNEAILEQKQSTNVQLERKKHDGLGRYDSLIRVSAKVCCMKIF